ncbi:DeoR family transcriptional regulator [Halovenus salina]|uniref:DeoR family transcriptional regulator n=1 Tax=Halovenus salina TaxID=1510225 RepID=A0ABD5W466_9EURY|nr:DeoR family transcriptional regulator [Halovenus salina]
MVEEDSGPFEQKHSDEELLQYIEEGEVVTTKEVAEHFEYHLQTARRRLKSLEREGRLHKKDVGKRFVWWLPRK